MGTTATPAGPAPAPREVIGRYQKRQSTGTQAEGKSIEFVKSEIAGSMRSNQHLQNLPSGHRRLPVLDFRRSPTTTPLWLPRPDISAPARYRARPGKLTADQEASIRILAATKSLRRLGAEFSISHETIRGVLRHE